eukprot:4311034-Prymnesium_polylepis.1
MVPRCERRHAARVGGWSGRARHGHHRMRWRCDRRDHASFVTTRVSREPMDDGHGARGEMHAVCDQRGASRIEHCLIIRAACVRVSVWGRPGGEGVFNA